MKTIVITGATSGIGKALTEYFVKDNFVFAGYRNENYAADLEKIGATPFYINMSDSDSIKLAAAFIKSKTHRIDTLINVAGCVVAGAVENIEVQRIREQFQVNTFSHLDFTQRLLDLLEGGRIINISSMSSFGIFPFVAPYCASKRAMDILFNSMMLETKRNIKVISVKPGVIATPLWEKSIAGNKASIEKSQGFEKEMNYMVKNARKNQIQGLDVSKVVNLIVEVNALDKPKSSYTVGFDAKIAEIISILPYDLQNFLIKKGLSCKIK